MKDVLLCSWFTESFHLWAPNVRNRTDGRGSVETSSQAERRLPLVEDQLLFWSLAWFFAGVLFRQVQNTTYLHVGVPERFQTMTRHLTLGRGGPGASNHCLRCVWCLCVACAAETDVKWKPAGCLRPQSPVMLPVVFLQILFSFVCVCV